MLSNFHILGAAVTLISSGIVYLIFNSFVQVDTITFGLSILTAYLIMELSSLVREWSSKGDYKRILKGVFFSFAGKFSVIVSAYIIVKYFTDLNAKDFMIFLVAIYFLLFIFEVLYIMRFDFRSLKKV
ncbi:MAG: hypothetical protein IH825_00820 [Candidatus Marinimicrobia bacterium]|nr:hypothetical protein [Candidatus Neomarinimicrobiota bacterium]